MLFCKSEVINLLFGSSNRLSMLCHLVIGPFFLLFIQIFAHIICSNIFYSLRHFLAFIILFVFLSFRYLSPPFPFPFHPFIDKWRDAKLYTMFVYNHRSINFPFPLQLRTLICFVYMCCCIDPLPSAAAAADSRSIQSLVAFLYSKINEFVLHCND